MSNINSLDTLFTRLWKDYSTITPQAQQIFNLFEAEGNQVLNDHVAFRTFNDPKIGVDALAKIFLKLGYIEKGDYHFEQKKLYAKHFEHPNTELPKVFISELLVEKLSAKAQEIIKGLIEQLPEGYENEDDLCTSGRPWNLSLEDYEFLSAESEYASWMSAWGFRANHFTVFINHLSSFKDVFEVNSFLKEKGFKLNDSGGEVKGDPSVFLEQSSTLASQQTVHFLDAQKEIPSCYYEFALRYPLASGDLYQGFVASSADKIFESTDRGQ